MAKFWASQVILSGITNNYSHRVISNKIASSNKPDKICVSGRACECVFTPCSIFHMTPLQHSPTGIFTPVKKKHNTNLIK